MLKFSNKDLSHVLRNLDKIPKQLNVINLLSKGMQNKC